MFVIICQILFFAVIQIRFLHFQELQAASPERVSLFEESSVQSIALPLDTKAPKSWEEDWARVDVGSSVSKTGGETRTLRARLLVLIFYRFTIYWW